MKVSPKYAPYIIRMYDFWTLYLNKKQLPYVGRCYAWWNNSVDGEGMPFDALSPEALFELQTIYREVRTAACEALGYDTVPYSRNFLLNKELLANEGHVHNHQMHYHFIPRSKKKFEVPEIGLCVDDRNWGKRHNTAPYEEPDVDEEILQKIKFKMANAMKR